MKSILYIFLFLSFGSNQTDFYTVFSNNSLQEINLEIISLNTIKNRTINEEAYLAALVMKKSSFEKDLKKKIKSFKSGALVLEGLIESNPENIELRFIRLIIQENTPKILKYNKNIDEDVAIISSNKNKLNKELQKEIIQYAERSMNLDF